MARKENPLRAYAIFSGIAIQMLAIIAGIGWLGSYIDDTYHFDKLFTAIGVLVGVGLSLYVVLIQLKRVNKDK